MLLRLHKLLTFHIIHCRVVCLELVFFPGCCFVIIQILLSQSIALHLVFVPLSLLGLLVLLDLVCATVAF